MSFEFSPLLGIFIAAVLGGAVGVQRQASAKPAGFRTHLLVATASAAFTAMGAHLHDTRIPSYVVVGIGFLGAGAIVRRGYSASGLTTAASIWMAAAIGLNLGYANSFGLFSGLLITAITLVALTISDSTLMKWLHIPQRLDLRVVCTSAEISAADIAKIFREAQVPVDSADVTCVRSDEGTEITEISYSVSLQYGRNLGGIVREIGALAGVRRVEATEPPFYGL